MDIKEIGIRLKTVYDKLLLFCVLLGLFVSFILLNVLVGREKAALEAARAAGPSGPIQDATALDTDWMQQTAIRLNDPIRIPDWTNRIMVPEVRVVCVGCGRPIPFEAETCPFRNCLAQQPDIPDESEKDSSGDGIPDWWKIKYGLDPMSSEDALQDLDGDGFTAFEEYLWQTDPTDPESHPPPVAKLKLLKVARLPMPLSFQGVSRAADGEYIFTLRHLQRYQDFHVRMGQTVEGYEIVDYEPKTTEVVRRGVKLKQDVSVLTIRRNDRDYKLTLYREDHRGELAARLIFLIDNSEYLVTVGDEITLRKNTYKIVDITPETVIVKDIKTGLEVSVRF